MRPPVPPLLAAGLAACLATGVARAPAAGDAAAFGTPDARAPAHGAPGLPGPRAIPESRFRVDTVAGLARAYLLLDSGRVSEGRAALLSAASDLSPEEATGAIQYAGVLGRLSDAGAMLMAHAGVLAYRGRGAEAARFLDVRTDSLTPADRPAVLAEAARMAERVGADSLAARLRTRLLADEPDAPEAAEAALALARYRARTPAGRAEAVRLLTELVTREPDGALVPEARRELERLGSGGR